MVTLTNASSALIAIVHAGRMTMWHVFARMVCVVAVGILGGLHFGLIGGCCKEKGKALRISLHSRMDFSFLILYNSAARSLAVSEFGG